MYICKQRIRIFSSLLQIFAINQCLPFLIVTKKIAMEIPTPEFTTDHQIRNLNSYSAQKYTKVCSNKTIDNVQKAIKAKKEQSENKLDVGKIC